MGAHDSLEWVDPAQCLQEYYSGVTASQRQARCSQLERRSQQLYCVTVKWLLQQLYFVTVKLLLRVQQPGQRWNFIGSYLKRYSDISASAPSDAAASSTYASFLGSKGNSSSSSAPATTTAA